MMTRESTKLEREGDKSATEGIEIYAAANDVAGLDDVGEGPKRTEEPEITVVREWPRRKNRTK
jgi:hypothetical protein